MKSSTLLQRACRPACAILLAAALASPAAAAKPTHKAPAKAHKPVPAAADPSSPTPLPPGVTAVLSRHTIETASAYRSYMDRAARISSAFTSGAQVEESLMAGAQSEPQQLSQGAIAYAAIVALQDPSFVAGVRGAVRDEDARRDLVRRIIENPNVVTRLPGSNSAAVAISARLGADGARVAGAGALVKQSAYDIQHSAWSKAAIPALPTRLARAKELSLMTMRASAAETLAVAEAVAAVETRTVAGPLSTDSMAAPTTGPVSRGLAIAALAVLGAGGEADDAVVQSLLNDPNAGFCMNLAKLNLNQCLSVAKPFYEDAFCLGQHILIDTGQCVAKGAGQSAVPVASIIASDGTGFAADAGSANRTASR